MINLGILLKGMSYKMVYTDEKLERIRVAEFKVLERYLLSLNSMPTQVEADQCLFGIINHITKFTNAYHNSDHYKNLPKKPCELNDDRL